MNSLASVSSSSPVGGNGATQRKGPRRHSLLEDAPCHRNISLVLRKFLGAQRYQWNEDICEGLELNMRKLSECLDKGVTGIRSCRAELGSCDDVDHDGLPGLYLTWQIA